MTVLSYTTAITGCLYRLFCYVFLQVVPTRLARPYLPLLYVSHVLGLLFSIRQDKISTKQDKPDSDKTQPISDHRLASTLILCLPSISTSVNWANLSINTILLAAVIDFAISPLLDDASNVTFTRVGAIYPDAAKVTVRYPFPSLGNASINILWREVNLASNESRWQYGPKINLTASSDWIGTSKIENLWPNTLYEYVLTDNNQSVLPYPHHPMQFSTFPDPRFAGGSQFRFAVSSCVTPNFPYRGPSYRKAIHGFDLLANTIDSRPSTTQLISNDTTPSPGLPLEFLLFLGDFIYADVPLYMGDEREAYRRLYRRNYRSPGLRRIYERMRMYPNHPILCPIINNYMGEANDSKPPYPNAVDAFKLYNANVNYDPLHEGQFYYEFSRGDVAFFVMDTRRYRSGVEEPDFSSRSMLGDLQLSALLGWLSKVNNTAAFKFVVSSVPFTTLWSHDAQVDSWAGFPKERQLLLDAFHSVPNVIVLSGDRHEFASIVFNGESAESYPVYEISTSPLSMFYIPLVRTLAPRSQANVTRIREEITITENGTEVVEVVEHLPKEHVLKYLPIGNSKWSEIQLDTTNASKPLLYVETFIDGSSAYK
ncbi:hypothetical protein P691DRAFT_797104 [Macrolepiota fuliginosa MF-IS2]|uniref:PhoD-like phosphatase metallophosphatase domain-containing protein n=1 Tax=Macrolepiota fuliginosa MF-IS2 TaxID=1400762 RepID=A0A9P5XIW9_9AGAR|nr:hypothetical protein P691DRAFT_797104 [Macrolepiota fuliginosa MF-IS2]